MTNLDVMRICVLDYLDHIRAIQVDLNSTIERYEEHIAAMERLGSQLSDMPKNPNVNVDAIPNMVIRLNELLDEVVVATSNYQAEVMGAYEICHSTPEATMLWLHYVERRTWAQVGDMFGYSMEHALRKSRDGYEPIYSAMPDVYRRMEQAL